MRLVALIVIVLAVVMLIERWISSLPQDAHAYAGAGLTVALAGLSYAIWGGL